MSVNYLVISTQCDSVLLIIDHQEKKRNSKTYPGEERRKSYHTIKLCPGQACFQASRHSCTQAIAPLNVPAPLLRPLASPHHWQSAVHPQCKAVWLCHVDLAQPSFLEQTQQAHIPRGYCWGFLTVVGARQQTGGLSTRSR